MSKHTKGPWDYQPGSKWQFPRVLMGPPDSKGRRVSLTIKGKTASSIARGAAGISHEEAEANACLMAAAPDMFTVIEMFVEAHVLGDSRMMGDAVDLGQELIERVKR